MSGLLLLPLHLWPRVKFYIDETNLALDQKGNILFWRCYNIERKPYKT